MADYCKIYEDTLGECRWRYLSINRDITADSGEGYIYKSDCERGIAIMKASKDVQVADTTISRSAFG